MKFTNDDTILAKIVAKTINPLFVNLSNILKNILNNITSITNDIIDTKEYFKNVFNIYIYRN